MTKLPDPKAVRGRNARYHSAVVDQLRAERIKQGLTQPGLALKCRLGVSQLCAWENGHTAPSLTNLNRWADGLGLEIAAVRPGEQPQDEWDGDVRAVAEACAGVVDGTAPQPYRHEYAVRRLRDRFADRIAALDARDAKVLVKRTPDDWCVQYEVDIVDPDGWRHPDAPAWEEPITLADFYARAKQCTVRNVALVDWSRIAHDAKAED